MRNGAIIAAALLLGGCAASANAPLRPGSAARCDAPSPQSRAARAWRAEQRWRFADDAAARAAYQALLADASPWPDWVQPVARTLPPGTRFQMAYSPGQPVDRPGGFGTFDRIASARVAREALAVRAAWKPRFDRVVTFEVTQPLPVEVGPVGPQIDPDSCRLLPGRFSQLRMTVPPDQRMAYLRVIEVREIR